MQGKVRTPNVAIVCDNIMLYCFYETNRNWNDLFHCMKLPTRLDEMNGWFYNDSLLNKMTTKRFVAE